MNEIIAAIIGALTGAVLIWLSSWAKSRRGNRIVVAKVSQSPQITISKEARKGLSISYKGKPVDQLVLSNLRISNEGTSTIDDLNVQIKISQKDDNPKKSGNFFIEVEHSDPLGKTELVYTPDEPSSPKLWTIDFKRPFINSRRAFPEEAIKLAIFSSHESNIMVLGGGAGWYTKFVDEEMDRSNIYKQVSAAGTSFSAFLMFVLGVGTILAGLFSPFGDSVITTALIGIGILIVIAVGLFGFNAMMIYVIERMTRENPRNKS